MHWFFVARDIMWVVLALYPVVMGLWIASELNSHDTSPMVAPALLSVLGVQGLWVAFAIRGFQ